jgi:hypothetical protein
LRTLEEQHFIRRIEAIQEGRDFVRQAHIPNLANSFSNAIWNDCTSAADGL